MVTILEQHRDRIAAACARHGVLHLDAFGSSTRNDFRPGDSDVDLLVEFGPMDVYARIGAYFELLDERRDILGAKVDLVMVGAVKNRYLAADIERTKQPLYAA